MVFFNPQLEISILAALLAVVSQFVQTRFGNRKEMIRHQTEMKKNQEKMKKLVQSNNPNAKKEMEILEKEMLESLNMVMKMSTKTMIYSMVIFLPAFFLLGMFYSEAVINLPIPIPWFAPDLALLNPFSWVSFYTQTNWVGWYVLNSIIFSLLIITPLTKYLENRKEGVKVAATS